MKAVRDWVRVRTVTYTSERIEGDDMAELDRTVWTAPVRNFDWVLAHFGHR
jgi:hypothetical protein